MRRAWLVVALIVMMFPLLGVSGAVEADYRDDFGDGGYNGNDGSLDFDGPWVEAGDDGSPSSGAIHNGAEWCSNNRCAHFESEGLLAGSLALYRFADLSDFSDATLTFDLAVFVDDPLGLNTAELRVQVMSAGGWKTVRTYGLTDSFEGTKAIDVTGHASGDFGVRFIVGGTATTFSGGLSVDRVEISGLVGNSTATTSSTSTSSTSSTSTTSTSAPKPSSTSSSSTSTTSTTSTTTPAELRGVSNAIASTTTTSTTTIRVPTDSTNTTALFGAAAQSPRPPDSGLHEAGSGVMADYEEGAMGDMSTDMVEVLGVGINANFTMAVEVFEAVRWWVAGLALLIVAATIGLIDRRRSDRPHV